MMMQFPFSAIVGQELLKTALLVNAVDPSVGGVLIRGEKGTGKSTAVRALAALLPEISVVEGCPYHCSPDDPSGLCGDCSERLRSGKTLSPVRIPVPLVDLPLNASEDRLSGSLHIERALQGGVRNFEPGLLAAANRGILYIDEVNLLEDHLVDFLLDAAASGVNRVEREGISVSHPARFILVGTMNPEEGDLRPQFLDRFGLSVSISGITDRGLRGELLRRRIAFERDPPAFAGAWQAEDSAFARMIREGRERLARIDTPDAICERAVDLASEAQVHGHRAEIVMVKTAAALAALTERNGITDADLDEAARLALPHRLHLSPLERPEDAEQRIERLLSKRSGEERQGQATPDAAFDAWADPDSSEGMEVPGATAAGSILLSFLKKKLNTSRLPD